MHSETANVTADGSTVATALQSIKEIGKGVRTVPLNLPNTYGIQLRSKLSSAVLCLNFTAMNVTLLCCSLLSR
jgi:hypothetical protein